MATPRGPPLASSKKGAAAVRAGNQILPTEEGSVIVPAAATLPSWDQTSCSLLAWIERPTWTLSGVPALAEGRLESGIFIVTVYPPSFTAP